MTMLEWAKQEVEILRKTLPKEPDGFNYELACAESALAAFEVLCDEGHSGMSIQITKGYINRLIDGRPLTVIEDIPENWNQVDFGEGRDIYQCARISSLFKEIVAGEVKFSDNNRYVCVDINNDSTYTGGKASDIIDELYPIKMPYWPTSQRIKLYTEDFLVDPNMGDYDTKGYLYLIHPTDGRVEVNRFFKETEEGWKEIDHDEYKLRKSFKLEKEETTNEQ